MWRISVARLGRDLSEAQELATMLREVTAGSLEVEGLAEGQPLSRSGSSSGTVSGLTARDRVLAAQPIDVGRPRAPGAQPMQGARGRGGAGRGGAGWGGAGRGGSLPRPPIRTACCLATAATVPWHTLVAVVPSEAVNEAAPPAAGDKAQVRGKRAAARSTAGMAGRRCAGGLRG
jgi:hypothetical protein